MKSDQLLQQTLAQTTLPIKQYEYKGAKPEYIVFNEEDERGIAHADDGPQAMSLWWQVHLFAPKSYDYRARKRQIKNLLLEAGLVVRGITTLYEKETETMHVVISCNIIENMED